MYIHDIIYSTSVDGPGLRNALYTQGCPIHCPGCHNSELWNWEEGDYIKPEEVEALAEALTESRRCTKISILGGEPLSMWNVDGVIHLCSILKEDYGCEIWLWSGYTLDAIKECPERSMILDYIDVLVDGRYDEKQRFENGKFRGSANQRIYRITNGNAVDETDLY